jgi:hypothetical protein
MRRFVEAIRMRGAAKTLTLLRLRAEALLDYADEGKVELTQEERDVLDRIAVAPEEDDQVFLGGFDERLERMGRPL